MLQVVPRWNVSVRLASGICVDMMMADNHIENVLRTVASITWSKTPLDVAIAISVTKES